MNTKDIGDISEAMVLAAFVRAGRRVLVPFGDNRRYDLVVEEEDGRFERIQVKTARYIVARGVLVFDTTSAYTHRGRPARGYQGEADVFAAYSAHTGKVYVIRVSDVGIGDVCLRLTPARNNQMEKVRWATDYEFNPDK